MNEQNPNWINVRNVNSILMKHRKDENVDTNISKIVGHKILATDRRLIKLVVEFNSKDPDKLSRLDKNPEFIRRVKETFK